MQRDEFLASTDVVDWQHASIHELAVELARGAELIACVSRCFHWVRDQVTHTFDVGQGPVTCRASDVLRYRTGICYAKSHLLAALLRANGIPVAFGYQRLALDDAGTTFCLHSFNYVFVEPFGWHPLDPRGNSARVSTSFNPPHVSLAFVPRLLGERTLGTIFGEPLPIVINTLQRAKNVSDLEAHLPDWDE